MNHCLNRVVNLKCSKPVNGFATSKSAVQFAYLLIGIRSQKRLNW